MCCLTWPKAFTFFKTQFSTSKVDTFRTGRISWHWVHSAQRVVLIVVPRPLHTPLHRPLSAYGVGCLGKPQDFGAAECLVGNQS